MEYEWCRRPRRDIFNRNGPRNIQPGTYCFVSPDFNFKLTMSKMILNNGTYGGHRILKPETVNLIFQNFNTAFPTDAHGAGFELDQTYWSGPMASLQTAGHTGFTGTTMAIDRRK